MRKKKAFTTIAYMVDGRCQVHRLKLDWLGQPISWLVRNGKTLTFSLSMQVTSCSFLHQLEITIQCILYFVYQGVSRQIHWKAVNARAKTLVKAQSVAAAGAVKGSLQQSALNRKSFLEKVLPKQPPPQRVPKETPASPKQKEGEKRPGRATGSTRFQSDSIWLTRTCRCAEKFVLRSVVSVVHLWFLSNREANKLRHIKNGNTNWYQSHKILKGNNLTFGCLNCGGLQDNLKRQHIASLGLDIIVHTETHLQQHMLHTESEQFPEYYCF